MVPANDFQEGLPQKPSRSDEGDLEPRERSPRPKRRRAIEDEHPDDGGISTLIPYTNPKALIAYYLGVFALIPCLGLALGPAALILGILGLRTVRKYPTARGTGHAIAGIVLGSLVLLGHLAFFGFVLASALLSPR